MENYEDYQIEKKLIEQIEFAKSNNVAIEKEDVPIGHRYLYEETARRTRTMVSFKAIIYGGGGYYQVEFFDKNGRLLVTNTTIKAIAPEDSFKFDGTKDEEPDEMTEEQLNYFNGGTNDYGCTIRESDHK